MHVQKWISWVVVGCWMGVIFYLSHQPAGESSALSSGVVQTVVSLLEMLFTVELSGSEVLHFIVRKGAHVFAYFVLALLVLIACLPNGWTIRKRIGMTLVICTLYAASDEVHQLFIAGRSGQVTDVLIDTIGSCLGVGVYVVITKVYKRIVRTR